MKPMRWLSALLVLVGCTTVNYTSPDFERHTRGHETIAVLPFEMVFTGKLPRGIAPAQIQLIEEAESVAFQAALYHRLLNRSDARRKRPILVELQPYERTLQLLDAEGIGVRESWSMPAEKLAEVLGVDAVVRTGVQKTRYLSDLGSYGVEVGQAVLHEAAGGELDWVVPPGAAKTYDIWAESSLLSRDGGRLLWKVAVHRSTDWQRPANDVIDGITKRLAKEFPYRG